MITVRAFPKNHESAMFEEFEGVDLLDIKKQVDAALHKPRTEWVYGVYDTDDMCYEQTELYKNIFKSGYLGNNNAQKNDESLDSMIKFRISKKKKALFVKQAKKEGLKLSEWCTMHLDILCK